MKPQLSGPTNDRDEARADIEARYVWPEKHQFCTAVQHKCWSVLGYVYSRLHALAIDYLDWRAEHGRVGIREDLSLWETERFGSPLYFSAHGMLLFNVLWRAYPADERFSKLGPPPSVAPSGLAMPPVEAAVKSQAYQHAMPHGLGRKAHEARVNELLEQARS